MRQRSACVNTAKGLYNVPLCSIRVLVYKSSNLRNIIDVISYIFKIINSQRRKPNLKFEWCLENSLYVSWRKFDIRLRHDVTQIRGCTYPSIFPSAFDRLAQQSFPWRSVDSHFDFAACAECGSHAKTVHAAALLVALALAANLYQCLQKVAQEIEFSRFVAP